MRAALATLAAFLLLVPAATAARPHKGRAAGVFSAASYGMCAPSKRCDWYGLATCRDWGPNSVRCSEDAIDDRTFLNVRWYCHSTGVVDNRYLVSQFLQWCN